MKFLIMYQMVPEAVELYTLETNDAALIEIVRGCHSKYVNLYDMPYDLNDNIDTVLKSATLIYNKDDPADKIPILEAGPGEWEVILMGIIL